MQNSKEAGNSPINPIKDFSEELPASLFSETLLPFIHKFGICSISVTKEERNLFFEAKSSLRAKLWCRLCKIRPYCLLWAIEHEEDAGIWGGLDEEERRKLKDSN